MAGVTQEQIAVTMPSVALIFEQAKIAQSVTGTLNISMNAATSGTLGAQRYTMPYPGSIYAVTGYLAPVMTAGTITLYPTVNGTVRADVSANTTDSNGTLSQKLRSTGEARRDNSRFVAGDTISLTYVTDANVAPNSSCDLVAQVWVLLEEVRI